MMARLLTTLFLVLISISSTSARTGVFSSGGTVNRGSVTSAVRDFLDLSDTPTSYTNADNMVPYVNGELLLFRNVDELADLGGFNGTVTSITFAVDNGLAVSGSPITTNGTVTHTINLGSIGTASLNNDAGFITEDSSDTLTNKTINTASNTITVVEADISDLSHTTDTNANTICSGTTTYLDGEGNCDDISSVYQASDADLTALAGLTYTNGSLISVVNDTITMIANGADGQYLGVDGNGDLAWSTVTTHDQVTLAGQNYLSLSTQQITANPIELDSSNVNGVLAVANGGTGATTAGAARTALGLEIGTDVQAFNDNLIENGGNSFGNALTIGTNDAYDLVFEANNTTAMTIQANGDIGIGTASPASTFQVISSSTSGSRFGDGTRYVALGSNTNANWITSSSGRPLALGPAANANAAFFTSGGITLAKSFPWTDPGAGNVTIPGGKLGIGDDSPDATLEIAESGTTPFMISNGDSGDGDFFIVDTSGNVGIGTASPASALEIVTTDNFGLRVGRGTQLFATYLGDSSQVQVGTFSNHPLTFTTLGNARASFEANGDFNFGSGKAFISQSSGNVGIGITSPGALLHINGTPSSSIAQGIVFGDGDTGISEGAADDELFVWAGGTARESITTSYHRFTGTGGGQKPQIQYVTMSDTTPGFVSGADTNSGLGMGGADTLSLITGGVSALSIDASQDVGIGTTTPNANLHLSLNSSTTTFPTTTTNALRVENTNTTSGSYAGINFRSATADSYIANIYQGTANAGDLAFLTDNNTTGVTERMRIKSDGNVGIGTTSPSYPLEVSANGLVAQFGSDPGVIAVGDPTTVNAFVGGYYTAGGGFSTVYFGQNKYFSGTWTTPSAGLPSSLLWQQNGNFYFSSEPAGTTTTGTTRMMIDSSGNVGIGDTTPDATLEIAETGTTPFMISNTAAGDGDFFIVDTSGNVGIGTDTPTKKLQVEVDTSSTSDRVGLMVRNVNAHNQARIQLSILDDASTSGNSGTQIFHTTGTAGWANYEARPLSFWTGTVAGSASQRMIVDTNGDIGIGTSSPAYKLDVSGTISATSLTLNGNYTLPAVAGTANDQVLVWDNGGTLAWEDQAAAGSDTFTAIEVNGTPVSTNAPTLNFNGTDFTVTESPTDEFEIKLASAGGGGFNGNSLSFVDSTSSTTGVIFFNGDRFLHNFQDPTGGTAVPTGKNLFLGEGAGNFSLGSTATNSVQGSNNIGIGAAALDALITGYQNVAIGNNAMGSATSAENNTALGHDALKANTSGHNNTAVGYQALDSLSTSSQSNVGIGREALGSITSSASLNTSVGTYSLANLGSGMFNNVALGAQAGRYYVGSLSLTSSQNSIFIGSNVKASANATTNEIVIGKDAEGKGTNKTVLGNSSTTGTYLMGEVGIRVQSSCPSTSADADYAFLCADTNGSVFVISNGGALAKLN